MEPTEQDNAALISGIEAEARAEEQQIIEEAQKQADEKRKFAEKKIESILNDARKEAQEKAEKVKSKILSSVKLEVKRQSMHAQDLLMQDIIAKVEKKLFTMINDTNYSSVLINWITEAAIGLDAESALIDASEKERMLIDDKLLSQAREKIQAQSGKKIELKLCDGQPLKSQGIVLTAADGRTAFNNQVKTRMLRNQRKIRTLMYNKILAGDKNNDD
jgi:vacuolar-type H+-ATPase subunit E/Vma4